MTVARFHDADYKPVYIDGLGWISDTPQPEHVEYSKDRYYAELVHRAREGLERIRIGRETAVSQDIDTEDSPLWLSGVISELEERDFARINDPRNDTGIGRETAVGVADG